jgi:hypothetical protein
MCVPGLKQKEVFMHRNSKYKSDVWEILSSPQDLFSLKAFSGIFSVLKSISTCVFFKCLFNRRYI